MAVSVKMCIFNAIIFVILVQIVANSPYTSQQPMKHESSLSGKNFLVTLKSKERVFEKLCDGYVISPKSILAPAHCVYNFRNSSLFEKDQILVEYFHANGSISTPYLERKEVEYLSVPESFDVITMKDDIALLFLKEEIAKVKPLEINFDKNIENIYYLDDEDVIPTNLLTKETCGKFYRPASILEGMMCVQDEEYNGSKAVFMNDKLVGFESWKNNVVDLTYPKVFSNLAIYNQWIHRELQSHGEKDYGLIGILCYALFTIWVAKRSIKPVEENSMGI